MMRLSSKAALEKLRGRFAFHNDEIFKQNGTGTNWRAISRHRFLNKSPSTFFAICPKPSNPTTPQTISLKHRPGGMRACALNPHVAAGTRACLGPFRVPFCMFLSECAFLHSTFCTPPLHSTFLAPFSWLSSVCFLSEGFLPKEIFWIDSPRGWRAFRRAKVGQGF